MVAQSSNIDLWAGEGQSSAPQGLADFTTGASVPERKDSEIL